MYWSLLLPRFVTNTLLGEVLTGIREQSPIISLVVYSVVEQVWVLYLHGPQSIFDTLVPPPLNPLDSPRGPELAEAG